MTPHTALHRSPGFSLTEMSVVLIIIGLILSSVVAGAKFVDFAKARALVSGSEKYQSYLYGFLSKYSEYPGDFTEATIYWNNPGVENGDGDGKVYFQNSGGTQEGYNAWQHLALAGMAENDFIGAAGGVTLAVADTHVPSSVYGGGFFWAYDYAGHDNSNTLSVGEPVTIGGTDLALNGLIIQENARDIDLKADDGNPSEGSLKAIEGDNVAAGDCVDDNNTPGDPSDDFFNKTAESRACVLSFMIVSQ